MTKVIYTYIVSYTDPHDFCHSYSNLCRKPNNKKYILILLQGCNMVKMLIMIMITSRPFDANL